MEHTDGGSDDHALGDGENLAGNRHGIHQGRTSERGATSPGVATPMTGTPGAPRLASPASIEPKPTSTRVVAPSSSTMVVMHPRQRTGETRCCCSRSAQPSAPP